MIVQKHTIFCGFDSSNISLFLADMEENDSKFYWKGRSDPQIAVKEDITTMYHPDRFVFYIKILLKSAVCLHIFLLNSQFCFLFSLQKKLQFQTPQEFFFLSNVSNGTSIHQKPSQQDKKSQTRKVKVAQLWRLWNCKKAIQ